MKIYWYVWQTEICTGKIECVGAFDNPEDALERLEWCINSDREMHQWFRYTYNVNARDASMVQIYLQGQRS